MAVRVSTLTLVRLTPPLGYGYRHASFDTRAILPSRNQAAEALLFYGSAYLLPKWSKNLTLNARHWRAS